MIILKKEEIIVANLMSIYLIDTRRLADGVWTKPSAKLMTVQAEGLLDIKNILWFDKKGIKALSNSERDTEEMIKYTKYATHRITNNKHNIPEICEKSMKAMLYTIKVY